MKLRIYIGYDKREQKAFDVAASTASSYGHEVIPLYEERLRYSGMIYRPVDRRGYTWDFVSSAPQATDFAVARFFVPLLAHSGWSLFVDCDVIFLRDPVILMENTITEKAVYVVKHETVSFGGPIKMDGQIQTIYPRKLWSSVMLCNSNHVANKRLNLQMLNSLPGRDLHAFSWLHDEEIGTLPPEANWLVGLQPKPEKPIIAHFTLGTPDIPGREASPHADLWLEYVSKL